MKDPKKWRCKHGLIGAHCSACNPKRKVHPRIIVLDNGFTIMAVRSRLPKYNPINPRCQDAANYTDFENHTDSKGYYLDRIAKIRHRRNKELFEEGKLARFIGMGIPDYQNS